MRNMIEYKYKPIRNVRRKIMKTVKEVGKEGKQYLFITFVKNDILNFFFHEIIDNLENTIKIILEYIKDVEEEWDDEKL